ncbi:MAG: hypothetical protein VX017_06970 [Pseudomonadota bacterium]|jgi:hypothetical protein|nr:hypothetical protein [Pseudomonadota bacterium]
MGLKKAIRRRLRRIGMLRDVEAVKIEQAARYFAMFGGVVAHGPFSGFRMQKTQYWNHYDATAKLFGLYEKEVADRLVALSASHDTFIDIGAADGYFGVAAVCCGHFRQSVCFEISPAGRQSIRHAAELNGVADRVDIRGEADAAELKQVIDRCPGPAAVLIDIEGAEFAFLTDEVIDSLASCHVIIELHDWLTEDGVALRDGLMDRLSGRFRSHIVHTGARDLSNFPELADLPDSERWLVCDEGRGRSMEWLFLEPIS